MREPDQREGAPDADSPLDLRDAARPVPATPPVIDHAEAKAPEAGADLPQAEPVESSLLGQGGVPAARPRSDDATPVREASYTSSRFGADSLAGAAEKDGDAPRDPVAPSRLPSTDTAHDAQASTPTATGPAGASLPPPPAKRGGAGGMILGGAIAAALGGGAVWFAQQQQLGPDPAAEARAAVEAAVAGLPDADRVAALEAKVDGLALLAERIAAVETTSGGMGERLAALEAAPAADETLNARVAALEERPDATSSLAALDDRMRSLEQQGDGDAATPEAAPELDALAERISKLEGRPAYDPEAVTEARAAADAAREASEAATQAADAAKSDIDAAVADARTAADEAAGAVTSAKDEVAAAVADARAQLDEIEARVAAATERAEALAAVSALRGTLATGAEAPQAAATLADAGVAVPAADVPALTTLQETFPDAARRGLRAALDAGAGQQTGTSALATFLRSQTAARSVEPRDGTDADAILSRAGAAVERGEIAAALSEIAALPEPARAAMADWTTGAEAWARAEAALGQSQTQLEQD